MSRKIIIEDDSDLNYSIEETISDFSFEQIVRVCSSCGKPMTEGFVINEDRYYCSQNCLDKNFTKEEFDSLFEDGFAYWTDWETYLLNY